MKPYSRQWIEAYYRAILTCVVRYQKMANALESGPRSEILEFLDEFNSDVPLLKLDRWLGYVQRFMIGHGVTTVTDERNWTRALFRPLDFIEETWWDRLLNRLRKKPAIRPHTICGTSGQPQLPSKYDCSICGCPGYEC